MSEVYREGSDMGPSYDFFVEILVNCEGLCEILEG